MNFTEHHAGARPARRRSCALFCSSGGRDQGSILVSRATIGKTGSYTSPGQLAARLDDAQRSIVLAGPAGFAEADLLPEGAFDEDDICDRESGEEIVIWQPTEPGDKVRTLLENQGWG